MKKLSWNSITSTSSDNWRRHWQPTLVLLPGKSHGRRSLVGCSPWGHWELDMTEQLHFHFSLSHIGEGNGNPLQYSCLENPRDGEAWWSAVCGVTQSQTWLKWLSSSSSSGNTKMAILLKLTYTVSAIPNKILVDFFGENWQVDPKIDVEIQNNNRNNQNYLGEKMLMD